MSAYGGHESPERRLAAARSWAQRIEPDRYPDPLTPDRPVADRLQSVVEAAERAAQAIRYDAQEQAERHLSDAQRRADELTFERVRMIGELTDDLIHHAAQVKEHSERLLGALDRAAREVRGKLMGPEPAAPDPVPTYQPPAAPDAPAGGFGPPRPEAGLAGLPDGVLLRATQLAIAGGDRAEIGAVLRSEFGIDPGPVLDRVIGRP